MSAQARKRTYRSLVRADAAQVTRERIRQAAAELFLQRGYAGVSMSAIAVAAGVSRQTVFADFGSKFGLLRDLIEVRIAGDDRPVPVAEGETFGRIRRERDPRELLRLHAQMVAGIAERTAALHEMLEVAAATDAEAATLRRQINQQRLEGMGMVVDLIADLGALPPGFDRGHAQERLWLLTDRRPYLAARDMGWSVEDYSRWLGECSIAVLLNDPGVPR